MLFASQEQKEDSCIFFLGIIGIVFFGNVLFLLAVVQTNTFLPFPVFSLCKVTFFFFFKPLRFVPHANLEAACCIMPLAFQAETVCQ